MVLGMTDATRSPALVPHLLVVDAPAAIDYYARTLGARELQRYTLPQGFVVHADLAVGDARFSVAEERREWNNVAPTSLGGSPVVLTLELDDPDAVAARMVEAGGRIVFPVADQFYGKRQGRVADPFGHLWILSKTIASLSPEEIQRRVDAYEET